MKSSTPRRTQTGCSPQTAELWFGWMNDVFLFFPSSRLLHLCCRVREWRRGQVTHHWLWGAPSCHCGRFCTVSPASTPCTHTSPGPRSALDQSGGTPSHAERLYLETERDTKNTSINIFCIFFFVLSYIHHSFADHHKHPSSQLEVKCFTSTFSSGSMNHASNVVPMQCFSGGLWLKTVLLFLL